MKPNRVTRADLYGSVSTLPNQTEDVEREIDEAMCAEMDAKHGTRIEVRRLTADEWQIDRELRLAALAESPNAFSSTLEAEERVSDEEWRERLEHRIRFAARLDGVDVAAAGLILTESDTTAVLVGMWVMPPARGQGVGDALVKAALDWARDAGATAVHLWVTGGNSPAERLYARNGFVRTGGEQPITPGDPTRTEIGMTCGFMS